VANESASGSRFVIIAAVVALGGIAFAAHRWKKSIANAEPPTPPPPAVTDPLAALPSAKSPSVPRAPDVPPKKAIEWKLPDRTLTKREQVLIGTWTAKQDESGTEVATIAGGVLFDTAGKKGDALGLVEGVLQNKRIPTGCVWMELRADFRGHRSACALSQGEPAALEGTNPLTGETKELGTDFEWYLDGDVVKIHAASDLVVRRRVGDAGEERLRFRHWHLKMLEDDTIEELIPEHDHVLPARWRYLITEKQDESGP
jgi:hypothetical protein